MIFDPAHQSTLVELARVQKDREDLRRYADRLRALLLRVPGPFTDGSGLKARVAFLAEIHAAVAGEIEPQDPIADAAEDAAFVDAIRRMEAAEAREDAAAWKDEKHLNGCSYWTPSNDEPSRGSTCNCGLREALEKKP